MDLKRVTSALILFPIVAIILIFGNKYLVDVAICAIAILSLHEYFNSFENAENKEVKPIRWIAYIIAISIALIHVIPPEYEIKVVGAIIPVSILVLFSQIIATNMKYTIKDIAITFFGICYIVIFLMFIPVIRNMENGKVLVWYVFWAAWGTDVFAYLIGKRFGKHKFSAISPKKSVEGCIAGTIGAVIVILIYTYICNKYLQVNINYISITIVAIVLSLVGQIGDFAASCIKRYNGIKDYSNLIPGHGGMLDRIDSVIFIAPFAYFLLTLI